MTCAWTPDPGCLDEEWTDLDPALQERSLMLATSSLVNLTYNRVGTCPVTIRPLSARCECGWNPHIRSGHWYNSCAHVDPSEYEIPGPVGYIDELKIDGEVIDLYDGNWRLDDGHRLVWQGLGESPLPLTQDLTKPDTEPGTWSITYSRSHVVEKDGEIAVALLALEFAKACQPKKKCSLPRGVTSVARNGVNFTIEAGLFPNGLTGIDTVDQYILKWAPAGAPTQPAVVFDPRQSRARLTGAMPRPSGWA